MARLNVTSYFKKLLLQFVTEPDPLLAMLQWLTQQLMQLEAESKVGAQKNKHSRERSTYFSGYRIRRFDTRLGTLYLMVPKLRNGGYVPFFVVERKRSEQALIQVVQEAFINGVSTGKIERLAKALGIETLSASQVLEINKGLNEQVEAFRSRALEDVYPVLWVDAMYEKILTIERQINAQVPEHDPVAVHLLRSIPGVGKTLAPVILYEIHDINRFPTVGNFISYSRLVKCTHESGGKRKTSPNNKIGNVHLKWAFSEAACLFLRRNERGKRYHQRLVSRYGKAKALSIIAQKLGRTVYTMLKRRTPYDARRFFETLT